MRHQNRSRNFGRTRTERIAMFNSLGRAMVISERITTTLQKAKDSRGVIDKLITWGKRNDLHARRLAFSVLKDRKLVKILFDEISPRFKDRNGGYCRVIPLGFRKGDGAQMAILELVVRKEKKVKEPAKKKEVKDKHLDETAKTVKHRESKKEVIEEAEVVKEKPARAKKEEVKESAPETKHKEHKDTKKEPQKKFLGGFQKFFKKERDSL